MNTIYTEYNMYHNSINIYTSAGYMLRINCNNAEDGLKTTLPLTMLLRLMNYWNMPNCILIVQCKCRWMRKILMKLSIKLF